MPIRYGGVTYPNLRYGGVNYPNVRYGGVTYPLAAVPSLYSTVTVNLTGYTATATQIRWDDNVALPPTFDLNGANQTLSQVILRSTNAVSISILGTNRRWTPEFEATGRLIFTASDGETLEVMIANADMTEPYAWFPANGPEITLFVAHVRALADHDATLTLTDEPVSLYSTVTVNLSGPPATAAAKRWQDNVDLGSTFAANGLDQELNYLYLNIGGSIQISITGLNNRFTPEFVATGRIIITASDGEVLEVTIANADLTETYDFTPTNSADVTTFYHHIRGLTDQAATLTLTDDPNFTGTPAAVAPAFADDTGNAQTWTQSFAISPITVPAATGTPTPTYAAVGALPAGISFNPTTRVISGTPTAVGTGTIRIRATNSAGTDDWTVTYSTAAALTAPVFADDTGDAQTWTRNTAITPITVPEATGDPVPTYAAVDLPSGITFDAGTRVISGTPTTAGFGTVTITATNSAGTDDWTVAYTIEVALTLRERLEGVASGSGHIIDVTLDDPIAGGNANQHYVYEHTPSFGTLNYVYPSAMFTNPGIFWNERPRFNHNGGTNDEYIVALHRGGSTVGLNNYLPNLPDEWSWYVINTTDEAWVSWQANTLNASGTAWAVYKGRVDGGGGVNVVSPRSSDPLIDSAHGVMEWCFQRVLAGDTMIMALIDSNNFEPYP